MKPARVSFLPYETWRNPYQVRLALALEAQGVKVSPGPAHSAHPMIHAMRARLRSELDLVHIHWASPLLLSHRRARSVMKTFVFVLACRLLKLQGVKLVWTVHNLYDHERLDPAWESRAKRLLVGLCNRVIVHCPSALELARRAYHLPAASMERFSVIPHGHFIDGYPNQISRRQARDRLGLPDGERIFLYLGQVRAYKNLGALIETFREMDDPRARLLIAGEPASARLVEEIRSAAVGLKRVHLHLRRVPDQEVQTYMNAADAVVLPFREILTSSSLILAMSFGKATITPAMGCSPDLLADQPELLYNPDNTRGLLECLQVSRSLDLEAIGRRNLESVRRYSWEVVGQMTAAVYHKCLGEP
jgi:glycosyltransferase involved in cell wall biosynthesis